MSKRESPWFGPISTPSWPALDGDLEVDVVVVGGGICGVTAANLLASEGVSVALLEAESIGRGTTGGTTGKVSSQHGLIYHDLIEHHGMEVAAAYASANQAAIDQVDATVTRLDTDSSFQRLPTYVYTTDPSQRTKLEAEQAAAERLGLPATLSTETDLPFPVDLAVRFENQAVIDVAPYVTALAKAVGDNDGLIFEESRALGIREGLSGVIVRTPSGIVRASKAIVATLIPFIDRSGFFARMKPSRAYGVAAKLNSGNLEGAHINIESPTRSTRPWSIDGTPGIIVVGENHPTGHRQATPARWGELERWARDNFDVESFEYRWSAEDFEPVDKLPFIGRAPLTRQVYVATGFNKWGLTNGTAAGHMLADTLLDRPNEWSDPFDPHRIGGFRALAGMSALNFRAATRFILDRLATLTVSNSELDSVERGEGKLVRIDGESIAAYREPGGQLHAVSATCTHLGCTVQWNDAEDSWDCPCHGSRFSVDGKVLDGPATRPLAPVEIPRND